MLLNIDCKFLQNFSQKITLIFSFLIIIFVKTDNEMQK